MTVLPEAQAKPVGFLQGWQSDSAYPGETAFVSDIGLVTRGRTRNPGWLGGIEFDNATPLVSSFRHANIPAIEGRMWVPWAFTSVVSGSTSILSRAECETLGSVPALPVTTGSNITTTTILPSVGSQSILCAGLTAASITPLWNEVDKIRLLLPGFSPQAVRIHEGFYEKSDLHEDDSRASYALTAIRDLTRWLNRTQIEIAEMCGFSLRISRYWGSGKIKAPREATVRRLHEVHAFVGSLVDAVGRRKAQEWLLQPSSMGTSRYELLAVPDGVTTLLREASSLMFVEASRPERPLPQSVEVEETADLADAYKPLQSSSPIRRPRRVPRNGG